MPQVWTLARRTVVPGREAARRGVAGLAGWTLGEFPSASGTLLRDREQPDVLFSFGPWDDLETATRWRGSDGFKLRIETLRRVLLSSEPHMLDRSVQAGRAT